MDQFGEATSPEEHWDVCPMIRKVSRDGLEEELIECGRERKAANLYVNGIINGQIS